MQDLKVQNALFLKKVREKLKKNREYKYKDICSLLGEEVKTGNPRLYQLIRWKRFFEWNNPTTQKFIISKIYNKPREKVDKRKNNKGNLENLEKGRKKSPYQILDEIFCKILSEKFIEGDEDNNIEVFDFDYLVCDMIKIINQNFRFSKYQRKNLFEYLLESKKITNGCRLGVASTVAIEKDNKYIDVYFKDLTRKMNCAIDSSLGRLKEKNILDYEYNEFYVHEVEFDSKGEQKEKMIPANKYHLKLIQESQINSLIELKIIKDNPLEKSNYRKKMFKIYSDEELVFDFYNLCFNYIIDKTDGSIVRFSKKIMINTLKAEKNKDNVEKMAKKINLLLQERMLTKHIMKNKRRADIYKALNETVADLSAENIYGELEKIRRRKLPN